MFKSSCLIRLQIQTYLEITVLGLTPFSDDQLPRPIQATLSSVADCYNTVYAIKIIGLKIKFHRRQKLWPSVIKC